MNINRFLFAIISQMFTGIRLYAAEDSGGLTSLDELKKENEDAAKAKPVEEEEELPPVTDEDETARAAPDDDDDGDDDGGDDDDNDEPKPTEDWTKSDESDDDDDNGAKFTDSDVAQVRRKWKGRVQEQKSEIEELKQRIEEFETKPNTQQQQTIKNKPTRDDFDNEDDFYEALTDYKLELKQQQNRSAYVSEQRRMQQQQEQAQIQKDVDGHYLRAQGLAKKSGIAPEAYQAADRNVRKSIDSVFPDAGDAITDALIASMGEGSERVFYHLGVNTKKRSELIELFNQDRTGIKAAAYLGKLNAQLGAPKKRDSNAPAPADDVKGDRAGVVGGNDAMRRKYREAHSNGNSQKAFDLKRQAKSKGINVDNW